MKRKDLVSFSELAEECGVSPQAVSARVKRMGIDHHPLPYSSAGRGLAPVEADIIREYYEDRRLRKLVPA